MQVEVLAVRKSPKAGVHLAMVKTGDLFGEVLADPALKGAGLGDLKTNLRVKAGRLECVLKVHPLQVAK